MSLLESDYFLKLHEKAKYLAAECEKTADVIEHVNSFSEGGVYHFVCAVNIADKNKRRAFVALQNKILKFEFEDLTKYTERIFQKLNSVTTKDDLQSIERRISHVQKDFNDLSDHYLRFLKWISRNCNQNYVSQIFNYSSEEIRDLRDKTCEKEKVPPSAVLWLIRKDSEYVDRRVHCMPNATFAKNDSFGKDGDIIVDKIGNWLLLAKQTVPSAGPHEMKFVTVESIMNKIQKKVEMLTKDIPTLADEATNLEKKESSYSTIALGLVVIKLLFVALNFASVVVDSFVILPASYLYKKLYLPRAKRVKKLRASVANFIWNHKYKISVFIALTLAIIHDGELFRNKAVNAIMIEFKKQGKRLSRDEAFNLYKQPTPEITKILEQVYNGTTSSFVVGKPSRRWLSLNDESSFVDITIAQLDRYIQAVKTRLIDDWTGLHPARAEIWKQSQNATIPVNNPQYSYPPYSLKTVTQIKAPYSNVLRLFQKEINNPNNEIGWFQSVHTFKDSSIGPAVADSPLIRKGRVAVGGVQGQLFLPSVRGVSENGKFFETKLNRLDHLIKPFRNYDKSIHSGDNSSDAIKNFMNNTVLSSINLNEKKEFGDYLSFSDKLISEYYFIQFLPLENGLRKEYEYLYKKLDLHIKKGWSRLQSDKIKLFPAPLMFFHHLNFQYVQLSNQFFRKGTQHFRKIIPNLHQGWLLEKLVKKHVFIVNFLNGFHPLNPINFACDDWYGWTRAANPVCWIYLSNQKGLMSRAINLVNYWKWMTAKTWSDKAQIFAFEGLRQVNPYQAFKNFLSTTFSKYLLEDGHIGPRRVYHNAVEWLKKVVDSDTNVVSTIGNMLIENSMGIFTTNIIFLVNRFR